MNHKAYIATALLAGAVFFVPLHANAADDNDKKFLTKAAQADVNEIQLSQLAEQKSSNPDVRAFAEKMVTEHQSMSEGMKPFAQSWGITPPTAPDADHQKEIDKLNGLSGEAFDKEYMKEMVADHTSAYRAFTTEANDTKDDAFRSAVVKDKSEVAAHKNMAYDLKKKV